MEALVAVGLAGNVVQFVEFASKLVSEANSIRETGWPRSFSSLRDLVNSLSTQAEVVHERLTAQARTQHLSHEDQHLVDVTADCRKSSSEFLKYLDSLVPRTSTRSLQSVGTAIKIHFSHYKINNYVEEIDRLRSALTLATLLALRTGARQNHEEVLTHLQELRKTKAGDNATSRDAAQLLTNVLEVQQEPQLYALNDEVQKCLKDLEGKRKGSLQIRESKILNWLSFRQITLRYEEVPLAYQETFSWFFEESTTDRAWSCLTKHLSREVSKPYYINGKAGSGKSTLMKYILDHPSTKNSLLEWASIDDMELVVTSFFFWNLGTPLQKTTAGLLRSLLWSVLREHPELTPAVFPDLYQSREWESDVGDITCNELRRAWNVLLEKSRNFLKMAIFIDGIDEFEEEHSDLIDFITSLCSTRVKFVVSSRPITSSLHAFRGCPSLKLEDLTKRDIETYVQGKLASHAIMQSLASIYPDISRQIITEIKEKAKGVFLWVRLVVKLLLDGLEAGDNIEELQAKLHDLPDDLKALYRRMLFQIPHEYRTQAVQILQLLQTWRSFAKYELCTLLLHYALRPPQESLSQGLQPLSSRTLAWYTQQTTARVQSRCSGLLGVTWIEVSHREVGLSLEDMMLSKVEYLHRTVAEFLQADDVKSEMKDFVHPDLEFHRHLAAACLSIIKISGAEFTERIMTEYVESILRLYRDAQPETRDRLEEFITSMDECMTKYNNTFNSRNERGEGTSFKGRSHWTAASAAQTTILGSYGRYFYERPPEVELSRARVPVEETDIFAFDITTVREPDMLTLAARLGFAQYLKQKAPTSVFNPGALIHFAFDSWIHNDDTRPPLNDRMDTLLFLLPKLDEGSDDTAKAEILDFAEGYTSSDRRELDVFITCFIVAMPSASWANKLTVAELRDLVARLQRDYDTDNQSLGTRLSLAVDDRLYGKRCCSNCRMAGHTRVACKKRKSKGRKQDQVGSGKVKKSKRRKGKCDDGVY